MNVWHINNNYLGTALHQTMIEHLDKCDCRSSVYVPVYDKSKTNVLLNANIQVKVCECFRKNDRFFFDYKQSKIIKSAEANFDIRDFDLIHAYTLFTDGNCAMKLAEKYNKPFVVAVRDADVNTFFKYRVNLRRRGIKIMQKANAIFFLSEAYRRYVFEKYVPKTMHNELYVKTYIMPNGIDDFWFVNSYAGREVTAALNNFTNKKLRLIYCGSISHRKNIIATIKAINILINRGWKIEYTAIGDIESKRQYQKLLSCKYAHYICRQPKEELTELYRQNDIFIMPSLTETFGLVYAEAMTQGLPVLYSRGQGFDRQFEEGIVGYAVDSQSPEEIARKILMTVENYEQIAPNCPRLAEKFRWDRIVEDYCRIYERIIKQ